MGKSTVVVLTLIMASTVISVIYLAIALGVGAKATDNEGAKSKDRKKSFFVFAIMLLCPVVGPAFFGISEILRRIFFRKEVDLSDVIFSKDRVESMARGDEDVERNIVPLEEALAVTDNQNLRSLMLNILKGDVHESLRSISSALYSDDTETAHYAASVLRDELNDFRATAQRFYDQVKKREDDVCDMARASLVYMNGFLVQEVFSDMEQDSYVHMMEEVATVLFETDREQMEREYYEWVTMRLLGVGDFKLCEMWGLRGREQYPDELSSYTCLLKLYFEMKDREKFFEVMSDLKSSKVVIDNETLELIRIFG